MTPDQITAEAIAARAFPGATLHLEQGGAVLYSGEIGNLGYDEPFLVPTTPETLYDLASVTKIYTTAAALLVLHEAGVEINARVHQFFPAFREDLKIRHLLHHTGGWGVELQELHEVDAGEWLGRLATTPFKTAPGAIVKYSCSNTFVLARILEYLTSTALHHLLQTRFIQPLCLRETYFAPPPGAPVAPTEAKPEGGFWQGIVHDEAARSWQAQTGGLAGNAGIFSTARDVAAFGRIWTEAGERLPPDLHRAAFEDVAPTNDGFRGLGWQIDNPAYMSAAPPGTGGHLGFTGPCLLVSPKTGHVAAQLSNRVHPNRQGANRLPFLNRVHTWMFEQSVKPS